MDRTVRTAVVAVALVAAGMAVPGNAAAKVGGRIYVDYPLLQYQAEHHLSEGANDPARDYSSYVMAFYPGPLSFGGEVVALFGPTARAGLTAGVRFAVMSSGDSSDGGADDRSDESSFTTLDFLPELGGLVFLDDSQRFGLAARLALGLSARLKREDYDGDASRTTDLAFAWGPSFFLVVRPIPALSFDLGLRMLHRAPHDRVDSGDGQADRTTKIGNGFSLTVVLGLSGWFF